MEYTLYPVTVDKLTCSDDGTIQWIITKEAVGRGKQRAFSFKWIWCKPIQDAFRSELTESKGILLHLNNEAILKKITTPYAVYDLYTENSEEWRTISQPPSSEPLLLTLKLTRDTVEYKQTVTLTESTLGLTKEYLSALIKDKTIVSYDLIAQAMLNELNRK